MVPIRVEVVSASERGRHVLPVFVDRLRCGQDALKKVEPAPLMGQTIGAQASEELMASRRVTSGHTLRCNGSVRRA
jgi:hypothetical protein